MALKVIREQLAREKAELTQQLNALRSQQGPMPGMGSTVVTDRKGPWAHAAEHDIRRIEIRLAEIDYGLAAARSGTIVRRAAGS